MLRCARLCGHGLTSKPGNRFEDLAKEFAGDGDLGQLEGDGAGMVHNAGPDLDQSGLQAGQGPPLDLFRKINRLKEHPEVIGQGMKLQPHLIVAKVLARQPRPIDRMLAFFYMLRSRAALIVELQHFFGGKWQVGHHKPDARKQVSRMPFDLRHDPA